MTEYIDIKLRFKKDTNITKALIFLSKAILIKFFLLISFICLIVDKVLIVVYNFHINFFYINKIFVLLKVRKNISSTIFILMSINNDIF